MKQLLSFIGLVCLMIFSSCSSNDFEPTTTSTSGNNFSNDWIIPQNEVFDGGVGKDGIPSIDNPQFATFSEGQTRASYLDALVVGIVVDGVAKAYPHPILDWHEIVNDEIGSASVAITYCPLTGTAVGWNRMVNNQVTEFGVSGLLYNTNLMPYDRRTDSTWSQQRLDCVNGDLIGEQIEVVPVVETTLSTWLDTYPDSEILTEDTGINRDYGRYPYGDYITNNSRLLFPISDMDNRLPAKERVLGVFDDSGQVKGYPFDRSSSETEVILDNFNGESFVIARNTARNFIVAFENPGNLTFTASQDFPAVLEDENGGLYDITGQLISNSAGQSSELVIAKSFIGYWFSWGTFYQDLELFE